MFLRFPGLARQPGNLFIKFNMKNMSKDEKDFHDFLMFHKS